MRNHRDDVIEGVRKMLEMLEQNPDFPLPGMSSENTYIAMITGEIYPAGALRRRLADLAYRKPGAFQEHYNWAVLPGQEPNDETARVRIIWVFGACRYEIDCAEKDVFPDGVISPISGDVTYLGDNVNQIHVPGSLPPVTRADD